MTGALVILYICSADIPRDKCNSVTARVSISTRIEQLICGVGVIAAPAKMALASDEFARIRCIMK